MGAELALKLGCILLLLPVAGCYSVRHSSGGGQTSFVSPRTINPEDIALEVGYQISQVATGLTFPTGVTFDSQGAAVVVESGYSYGEVWTVPRLLRIQPDGRTVQIAAGSKNGPWTGVVFHEDNFYVAEGGELEGGRILRISMDGNITVLVSNLPSMGDHHTDGPVIGPDGWLYFGQGTASNSGVVGEDNAEFGWLKRRPQFHDIPGKDIKLTGHNFVSRDPLSQPGHKATTGAYLPFGTASQNGQVIPGALPCSGSVMRIKTDGTGLELVAWGLRNPFGLAFTPEGRLLATENGYDDRGSRPVWGAPDVLWEIKKGSWYGWPDFSAGIPLSEPGFKPPGKAQPQMLLAEHPNVPPKPVALFGVHSSANGLDISRNEVFGHVGQAFVALFGDQAPTVGKVLHPVGFKVVRVNLETGVVDSFAANKGKQDGPASLIKKAGFERPLAVRFDPKGSALYVVDFGVLTQDKAGSHPVAGTGVIWRIERSRPRPSL